MSSRHHHDGHVMKIVVAMCDVSRGIALGSRLPWPSLSKDLEFYRHISSFRRDPDKVVVQVRGRLTWEASTWKDSNFGGTVANIVISPSRKVRADEHPSLVRVVDSFQEAVDFINCPPFASSVESVWIIGGQSVYQAALEYPRLQYVYLTRVLHQFPSDVFFPPFEEHFVRVSDPDVPEGIQEENGVRYQFEVYKRK